MAILFSESFLRVRDLTGDPTLVFQMGKEFSFRDSRLRNFMSIPSPVLEHINRQLIGEHLVKGRY